MLVPSETISTSPLCGSVEYIALASIQPMSSVFARSDWSPIWEYPRTFLARMSTHKIDNMASRFPDDLSEAQTSEINEKAIPINTKKVTKFNLGVFLGRVLFLNIVLRLNFTRKAEVVKLTRNSCQLPGLFTDFKIRHKDCKFLLH